jgi:hypothetical protein
MKGKVNVRWHSSSGQLKPQPPHRIWNNTSSTCGTFQGNTNYCRNATFSDLGELDDRGYIYNMDRAGSGLTILKLT